MEKVAPTSLTEYLTEGFITDPERSIVTLAESGYDKVNSEILCTTGETTEIVIQRIGKNVLQLDNGVVTLSPPEVRIINSLLVNKGVPLCTPEIQKVSDRSKATVHTTLKKLVGKLRNIDGEPLIKQAGVVMPNARQAHRGYFIEQTTSIQKSSDDIRLSNPSDREEPLRQLLSLYRTTPNINRKLGTQKSRELHSYTSLPSTLPLKSFKRLLTDEFYDSYRVIDKAVAAYMETDDPWENTVSDGVLAWHAVYYSGLGLMRSQLISFEHQAQLYGHRDDLMQVGALELWRASMNYDATKAGFPHYAIRCIAGGFSRAANKIVTRYSRDVELDMSSAASAKDTDTPLDKFVPPVDNTEDIPARMFQGSLAAHVINHPLLRPSEKLVLSLYFGVYSADLDGVNLTTTDNTCLVYDSSLPKNLVFRDGLSQEQIASIVGLSHMQIYRIWSSGMAKARDVALTKVYTDLDYESYRNKTSIVFQP